MGLSKVNWVFVGIVILVFIVVLVLTRPSYFGLHTALTSTYNEKNLAENFSYYNITEKDIRTGREVKILVKAKTPYGLPDNSTKISVNSEYYLGGRNDIAELQLDNVKLGLLSFATVAAGGFVYEIQGPYNCTAYTGGSKDYIITLLDSCYFNLTVSKEQSPQIVLENYSGIVNGIAHSESYGKGRLYKINGTNGHFISARNLGTLYDNISFEVINNFGVQLISFNLSDKKPIAIRIGSEEIRATLLGYNRESRYFTLKLDVIPIASSAESGAIIIDYSNGGYGIYDSIQWGVR